MRDPPGTSLAEKGKDMSQEHVVQRPIAPVAEAAGAHAVGVLPPVLGAVAEDLNDSPRVRQLVVLRTGLSAPAHVATVQRAAHARPVPRAREPQAVVQRAMVGAYYNPPPAALQAKMDKVLATINRMGAAIALDIILNLDVTEDPQHVQTNPADTRIVQLRHPTRKRIDMTIRSWYVETSSVGEIIGMIAHELGVHSLTDLEMTADERDEERGQDGAPYTALVAGATRPRAPLNGDRRQDDHVRVGKFVSDAMDQQPDAEAGDGVPLMNDGAPPDDDHAPRVARQPLVPMPRMEGYIRTMLRMGDAIEAAPIGAAATAEYTDAAARLRAQQEMFQTFLFDLGRLIATDDGGMWAVGTGLGDIAAVFNWLQGYLVQRYGAAHAWLAQMQIAPATFGSLLSMLGGKAAKALWAQRGAIARTAGRAVVAAPGAVLGAAAAGAGAVAGAMGAGWRWLRGG